MQESRLIESRPNMQESHQRHAHRQLSNGTSHSAAPQGTHGRLLARERTALQNTARMASDACSGRERATSAWRGQSAPRHSTLVACIACCWEWMLQHAEHHPHRRLLFSLPLASARMLLQRACSLARPLTTAATAQQPRNGVNGAATHVARTPRPRPRGDRPVSGCMGSSGCPPPPTR
jgi:hypothetical protein